MANRNNDDLQLPGSEADEGGRADAQDEADEVADMVDAVTAIEAAGGPLGLKTDVAGIHGVEMTVEEILARKRPTSYTQPICLDGDLADARDTARQQVLETEQMIQLESVLNGGKVPQRLAAQLRARKRLAEKAEAAAAPATAIFRFEAVGRKVYDDLIRQHPPTKAQADAQAAMLKANGRQYEPLGHNTDTFPPVILALSCAVPKLSLADALLIWNGREASVDAEGVEHPAIPAWSEGECGALYQACLAANRIVR